jgi:hypothetical protein
MLGNSLVSVQLTASQEGLSSMELVVRYTPFRIMFQTQFADVNKV